jgi:sec-independent protein translocase protein TatA
MVNPFDIRTVLLAKHAQHVVLIHFPIALFITGVGLDLLSRGNCQSRWASAAYVNLSLAAAMVIPAVLTGVLAWQLALEGKKLKGLLLYHVVVASIAAAVVIASWWMHWRSRKGGTLVLPRLRIPVELFGVAVVGLTAHLGGYLTGVNSWSGPHARVLSEKRQFLGQSQAFFNVLNQLAVEADSVPGGFWAFSPSWKASAVSAACTALAFFNESHFDNFTKECTMFEGLFQPMHLLVIFGIALLVFGPKKLPELGKGIGEGIRGFKSAMKAEEEKAPVTTSAANEPGTSKE